MTRVKKVASDDLSTRLPVFKASAKNVTGENHPIELLEVRVRFRFG